MENNKFPKKELLILSIGEAICALMTVLVFLAVDLTNVIEFTFHYSVITGAILGVAVIVLNFLFLSFSVNKAVDDYIALRGDKEMTDEEAEAFAAKNSGLLQNAVKKSFIVRMVSIAAALVVAFLTSWFNPLATVIPILAYQPILTWGNHIVESVKRVKERLKAQKESAEMPNEESPIDEEVEEALGEAELEEEVACEPEVEEETPCEAESEEEVDAEESLIEEEPLTEDTTSNEEPTLEDEPQEENTEGVR